MLVVRSEVRWELEGRKQYWGMRQWGRFRRREEAGSGTEGRARTGVISFLQIFFDGVVGLCLCLLGRRMLHAPDTYTTQRSSVQFLLP